MSNQDIAKDATNALREALTKNEDPEKPELVDIDGVKHRKADDYGWITDDMEESQTDEEVNHDSVDEEYADVEGDTPEPDNDEGSSGDPSVGTKQVSDAVTETEDVDPVEIGHLEINEYYRVYLKDPAEAPPEVEVHPVGDAQAPPPTEETTHYYDAPFESSVAAVGIENAAEKLADYDVDPDFPNIADIEKSQVSQADLWLVSAVRGGFPEKVTRTSLEMTKSPLTLFYASKRIQGKEAWNGVRKVIREELRSRGVEGVDKIRKTDPVKATKSRELNKRKVYVQDESKVPDQYEPQYGPSGGLYYEPDGGNDDAIESGDDLKERAMEALEEGDLVDKIPVQAWRDYTGQIDDQEFLVKSLSPIQDHGTKTAKDRIRQRLRGMGLSDEDIDDLLNEDPEGPYSGADHEDWQENYTDMEIVKRETLWNTDAKTGASAEYMAVETLEDDTVAFSTRYGGDEGNDPEARERQMATYKASRVLTAEGNVPPHVEIGVDDTEGDYDKVAVKEFDGQEAWEAPPSYYNKIDRDDYVDNTAKQLLCGNNDLHGDNIMISSEGDLGFHDLDHSAGRLDQNDPLNSGTVIEGALRHITKTGQYIEVEGGKQAVAEDVVERATEIAEERGDALRELVEENDNPFLGEMLENIAHNLEVIEEVGEIDAAGFGVEVDL